MDCATKVVTGVLAALTVGGCARSPQSDYVPKLGPAPVSQSVEYSFGVLPLHNAMRLYQIYQPLIDAINSRVRGFSVRMETAVDHPHYEAKVRDGKLDFILMNSHLVIPAEEQGYTIIGRTSDKVRGLVLVRIDSKVRRVRDLKHASISFSSRTDLAGSMMPRVFLKENGLDVDRDAKPKYVGSPESVIMNVYYELSAAGCVSESAWHSFQMTRPDKARSLAVRWTTYPLEGMGVLARNDLPRERIQQVSDALFGLDANQRGRAILAGMSIASFMPANEASYDSVWEFLTEYRRLFGRTPALGDSE